MALTNLAQVVTNLSNSSQIFLSSGTYYPTFAFICSAFTTSPANGATYTNNSQTFSVTQVVGNILYATCSGFPSLSGTLTKSGGTGDSTVTFSAYQQPKRFRVRMVGGGAGGSGGGTGAGGNGTAGTASTLIGGSVSLSAGGAPTALSAINGGAGGGGGTNSIAGALDMGSTTGGPGGGYGFTSITGVYMVGGLGGSNPLFGCTITSLGNASGGASAPSNSGGGGSGAGGQSQVNGYSGCGGGSGGFVDAMVSAISASFAITIGGGGGGGTAGANGNAGGNGGSGRCDIEEYFQY